MRVKPALLILVTVFAAALVGCESKEGPAERAGKQIDQTTEQAGKQMGQAVEEAGKKVEETGDKMQEKTSQ